MAALIARAAGVSLCLSCLFAGYAAACVAYFACSFLLRYQPQCGIIRLTLGWGFGNSLPLQHVIAVAGACIGAS
jgi:hypothetical protein